MRPALSAYVPCFNNAPSVGAAIASIKAQTVPADELFVIDDGSSDASKTFVQSLGVRLVCHETNLGRGAVRARAMKEASHEFVLCCDATNELPPNFVEKALVWLKQPDVAAIFGRLRQRSSRNAIERWRGRHLFKQEMSFEVRHRSTLKAVEERPDFGVASFLCNLDCVVVGAG